MTARSPRRVGPFELREIVGRGGMGVVWSAVHRWQRTPVAFKVMTHDAARNPAYLKAFRNEVRAAAGLSHPGIVEVYEHGEITEMLDSDGELRPGNPYLAMEWVSGGSLAPACGRLRWPALRAILRQLLDALAHAHARGVIHRDVKPANVLRSPGGGWLKLTDFGVSRWTHGEAERATQGISGTPDYMAPEQIDGRFRAHGPATDLYGLGCTAWELSTGHTPFEGGGSETTAILRAHLMRPPPVFLPRHAVPEGFEVWLRRLLEKAPADRFTRAADAAWALMQLGPVAAIATDEHAALDADAMETVPSPLPQTLIFGMPIRHQSTLESPLAAWAGDVLPDGSPDTEQSLETSPFGGPDEATTDATFRPYEKFVLTSGPPPIGVTWRRPEPPPWSARLMGAGLGLFALRTVPLVGRDTERDTLWSELARVHLDGRARLLLLTGAAGVGRTRLAEWLCESGHELGVATPLFSRFTPSIGATPPLADALLRHFNLLGLAAGETELALADLGVPQSRALAGWLSGPRPGELELPRAAERFALIRRAVESISIERPVVLVLDDAHWSPEAIDLACHLLDAQFFSPHRVLILMTAEEHGLAESSALQTLVRDLLTRPCTSRLSVGPLPEADRPALARSLLGLSEELTARLVHRTAGNPQMAVQLVSDWVARDLLLPHDHGFRFRQSQGVPTGDVPPTLRDLWNDRLARLLEGQPDACGEALERAAALGVDVDLGEWEAACAATGLTTGLSILEPLMARRLARPKLDAARAGHWTGFTFASAVLVECLEARALAGGRWATHHGACARLFADHVETGVAERKGRHLASAGLLSDALEPLATAARSRLVAGEYLATAALLELRETHLEAVALPPGDARWGEGWALRAWLLRARGEFLEADAWAARLEAGARRHGWPRLLCTALLERGRLAWNLGEPEIAAERLGRALALARPLGDQRLAAECEWQLADLALGRGLLVEASDRFDRARAMFISSGDLVSAGKAGLSLGEVARQAGQLASAMAHFEAARGWLRAGGAAWGEAECANKLGEVARLSGDRPLAAARYREAAELYRRLGSGMAIYPELNLGVVQIEDGHYAEAQPVLQDVLNLFLRQGTRGMVGAAHVCLAACAAGLGEGVAFDAHLYEADRALTASRFVDLDNARLAELAGDLWAPRGETVRAQVAWQLARAQWAALNREAEVLRLSARLA